METFTSAGTNRNYNKRCTNQKQTPQKVTFILVRGALQEEHRSNFVGFPSIRVTTLVLSTYVTMLDILVSAELTTLILCVSNT